MCVARDVPETVRISLSHTGAHQLLFAALEHIVNRISSVKLLLLRISFIAYKGKMWNGKTLSRASHQNNMQLDISQFVNRCLTFVAI